MTSPASITPDEPAFPIAWDDLNVTHVNGGMTLRDYFAAKAMAAFLTGAVQISGWEPSPETNETAREFADASYLFADAMMKARAA